METRDYTGIVPTQPPVGLIGWLKEQGKLRRHALIYKAAWVADPLSGEKERMVRLKCSACGGEMYAQRVDAGGCHGSYATAPFGYIDPVHGDPVICGYDALCPMCGAQVKVFHIGRFRDWIPLEEAYPMTVGRVEDKVVLTGWCVRHLCTTEGCEQTAVFPYEAYVAEEKKVVRLVGYHKCMTTLRMLGHWEQRKICLDNWNAADLVYPWDGKILIGTTAENSKLDIFMASAAEPVPVSYLRLWQKRKNVENLVTAGCGALVNSMIKDETQAYYRERPKGVPKLKDINWKEVRPGKMMGLTAEELRWCVSMGWTKGELLFFREARAAGERLKLPEDMRLCRVAGVRWCERLVSKGLPVMRCVRYLLRQRGRNEKADSTILEDYWRVAAGEGVDLRDPYNRYPPDLMKAHDRVMAIRKAREAAEAAEKLAAENEKLRAGFAKQLEQLAAYAWSADGMLIRPAEQPEELTREGDVLHHCVGTYRNKHAEGRSAIFFIRREDKPEEPWYTLELNTKELTVIQNRGKGNSARTESVRKFEEKWLEHIRKIRETKKKGKSAA